MNIATPAADRKHYFDDFSIKELAPTWGWSEEKILAFLLEMQEAKALFFSPRINTMTGPDTRLSALLLDPVAFVRFQAKVAGEAR